LYGLHIFSDLKVFILSNDGWSWALAWAQLGVTNVCCIPLSNKSLVQLDEIKAALGDSVDFTCGKVDDINVDDLPIVLFHQQGEKGLDRLAQILDSEVALITLLCSFDSGSAAALQEVIGFRIHVTELHHWRLGGLTTARIHVGWYPKNGVVQPGKWRNPTRPLGAFLKPLIKLKEWRFAPKDLDTDSLGCWDSNQAAPTRSLSLATSI
jgi:hypothetical protein